MRMLTLAFALILPTEDAQDSLKPAAKPGLRHSFLRLLAHDASGMLNMSAQSMVIAFGVSGW